MKIWKRIVLAAALGIGSTILAAIVPAMTVRNLVSNSFFVTPKQRTKHWDTQNGVTLLWTTQSWCVGNRMVEVTDTGFSVTPSSNSAMTNRSIPKWAFASRHNPGDSWVSEGYGWPSEMLTAQKFTPFMFQGQGAVQDIWSFRFLGHDMTLPTRIHWRGFVIDLGVFLALWSVLLFSAPVARRFWRLRRGLCLKCGYDVRTTGSPICPECGASVPAGMLSGAKATS